MNQTSSYTVSAKPIEIAGAQGTERWKALVNDSTNEVISIVSDSYRVVQNDEVFNGIENFIVNAVGIDALTGMVTKEEVSRGGLWAKKEWIFPEIKVPSVDRSKSDIGFRVIGINGFGETAIRCLYGAIDFFCTNGMVVGDISQIIVQRHFGKFDVEEKLNPIEEGIRAFIQTGKTWKEWQRCKVSEREAFTFFETVFSRRLAIAVMEQFQREIAIRGMTVWAMYSALTAYASHAERFPVSPLNKDSVASIMYGRELAVAKAIRSPEWKKLAS